MIADEFAVRIRPTQSALELVGKLGVRNTFVITMEPLLIHMLGRQPVNVVDFGFVNMQLEEDLLRENPSRIILYLEQAIYDSPADRERYKDGFGFVDHMQRVQLYRGENYAIYRIELPCCGSSVSAAE